MSNYFRNAYHPTDRLIYRAEYLDDYFGRHEYGVRFPDGSVFRADDVVPYDGLVGESGVVEAFNRLQEKFGKIRLVGVEVSPRSFGLTVQVRNFGQFAIEAVTGAAVMVAECRGSRVRVFNERSAWILAIVSGEVRNAAGVMGPAAKAEPCLRCGNDLAVGVADTYCDEC